MLEIVFNELSLEEKSNSIAHSQAIFLSFLQLADKINALKIAPVRIRMSIDFPNISIGDDYYTIKDWIKTLDNESRQRYLGFLVQNTVINDNPYFSFNGVETHGFGYAFNNNLGSISFSTNDFWNNNIYNIKSEFLADDGSIIIENVEVKNILEEDKKINHEKWLNDEFRFKQLQLSEKITNIETFWEFRQTLFPSLIFCPIVLEQLKIYESINNPSFKKALRYLYKLEDHIRSVKANQKNIDDLPGDISNDSGTTLDKYSEERTFLKPDNSSEIFSLHCKLGDVRIYMTLNNENIIIGYIGSHLRTTKFSK